MHDESSAELWACHFTEIGNIALAPSEFGCTLTDRMFLLG